jgi:class 3 adenylate cyclase
MPPETHYARSPDGAVGYQVFGDGPIDLVFVTQWGTNVDTIWEEPSAARYFDRLASFARVIVFDKRGTGVSDPVPLDDLPPADRWMEDIQTVMNAAESEQAVIVGDTEGGSLAIMFAATYPERTHSLVLINAIARSFYGSDYPIGYKPYVLEDIEKMFTEQHGTTGVVIDQTAPSWVGDARIRKWWVKFQRSTMPPMVVKAAFRWQRQVDVTSVLSTISVPTLVIHRRDNVYHRVEFGQWIADHIEGSEWVELDGADSLPFHAGPYGEILDHVEAFVTGERAQAPIERRLATVLFTDVVGSTQLAAKLGDEAWLDTLGEINRISDRLIDRFGGTRIDTTGDGCVAMFDSPANAVYTARAILEEVSALDVDMRSGLHTGEITVLADDIGGIGVHIASRVMNHAPDGGIAVSSTVKDLTVGSPIMFTPLGSFTLKGVPDDWTLYTVR